ncbi:MAG: glycosyltransferase [Vicinamibacterales bacterium]
MNGDLLIVAPYLPWPDDFGGAIRIYQIVRHLAARRNVILLAPATQREMNALDHLRDICDVTAVPVDWTFRQPASVAKRVAQFRSMGARTSFVESASFESRIQAVMDRLFMTRQIELVQYEFPQMALYRPPRPCPTILDSHNIEHDLLRRVAMTHDAITGRIFNAIEWRKVRRLERAAWSSVTLNVATSSRDALAIEEADRRPVAIVPNGVDVEAFASARHCQRVAGRVVFIGAMRHQPNANGARWYIENVHPRVRVAVPHATLELVGADPPRDLVNQTDDSIAVSANVASVMPHLGRAEVAIVPLHAGGGTRLKILEAFAAGVPVVSTTVGVEGIDAVPGCDLLVADSTVAFADAVIQILRHTDLPAQYSKENAIDLVRSRHDWGSAIIPLLEEAHREAHARFHAKGGTDVKAR